MGEVYKARDTRLERTVAIKVLPSDLADDPQFRERFDREARAVAALNHPHICTIHDVGEAPDPQRPATSNQPPGTSLQPPATVQYLVMELLAGETLAGRLERGALPLDEALRIAIDVASALEAAHRAGIVHRDLKPGNIFLTKAGTKLLDFGLAKAAAAPIGPGSFTMLPTTPPAAMTAQGTILGTFQYMAPEQVEGLEVDARTDIFAFGAVLYEMLTGRKAFEGRSQASLIGAILEREPASVSTLLPMTPPALDHVVKTCLAKNPDDRFHSAHDLLVQLKWIREGHSQTTASTATATLPAARLTPALRRKNLAIPVLAAIAAATVTGFAVWKLRPEPPLQGVKRFEIVLPDSDQFSATGRTFIAVSPDARHLVYAANLQLYLRPVDQLKATVVEGTRGATSPFFSPDGQWIGFWQDDKLKKVAVTGGATLTLCQAANPFGVSWGADGTILFGQGEKGISQVPSGGGEPKVIITVDPKKGESAYGPRLLPGGRLVLFTVASATSPSSTGLTAWDQADIVIQSPGSGERKTLIRGGSDARYLPTGHLVYARQGTLLAVTFDPATGVTTGSPTPLVEGVRAAIQTGGINFGGFGGGLGAAAGTGAAEFAVSADGLLAYVEGLASEAARTLVWVDRKGHEMPLRVPERAYTYPRISPDGRRSAVDIRDQDQDIWVWDFDRETLTKLTFGPAADTAPLWTLDGQRIIFFTNGQGLRAQASDGTGSVESLTESGPKTQAGNGFTHDGKHLIFSETTGAGGNDRDIRMLQIDGHAITDLLADPKIAEADAELSPDGHWLAYESNESGRFEIYVRPFPDVQSGRWQISRDGGTRPLWARNGRELFFMAGGLYNSPAGSALMVVPVETSPAFRAGNPQQLLPGPYFSNLGNRTYDVSADGKRFLMVKRAGQTAATPDRIIVVDNWFEELKRRVPAK